MSFQEQMQRMAKTQSIKNQKNPLKREYEFPPDVILRNKLREQKRQAMLARNGVSKKNLTS